MTGSTSPVFSQVIEASAKVAVNFPSMRSRIDEEAEGGDHAGAERAGEDLLDVNACVGNISRA